MRQLFRLLWRRHHEREREREENENENENEILLLSGVDAGTGELLADADKVWARVEVDKLRDNMRKALNAFTKALPTAEDTPGFKLTEIEVGRNGRCGGPEVGFLGYRYVRQCSSNLETAHSFTDNGVPRPGKPCEPAGWFTRLQPTFQCGPNPVRIRQVRTPLLRKAEPTIGGIMDAIQGCA